MGLKMEGVVEIWIGGDICNHLHQCLISCLVWSLFFTICLVLNLTNCVVWCPPEIVIPSLPVIPGATFFFENDRLTHLIYLDTKVQAL